MLSSELATEVRIDTQDTVYSVLLSSELAMGVRINTQDTFSMYLFIIVEIVQALLKIKIPRLYHLYYSVKLNEFCHHFLLALGGAL